MYGENFGDRWHVLRIVSVHNTLSLHNNLVHIRVSPYSIDPWPP